MRSRRIGGAASSLRPRLVVLLLLLLLANGLLVSAAHAAAYIRPGLPASRRVITMQVPASSSGGASPPRRLLPPGPFVVYLTPGVPEAEEGPALEAWYSKVQKCAAAGVAIVQLRDKRLSPTALLPHMQRCRQLVDAGIMEAGAGGPRTRLMINGHIDVASECGADGVHLPEAMLDEAAELKRQGRLLVGASVHSVEAALRAAELGVDYIQVGTMFPTASHPEKGAAVEGPALMARVDAALRAAGRREALALVGVGGIAEDNCARVVAAGADGVAVISGLSALKGPDVRVAVRALEAAMRRR